MCHFSLQIVRIFKYAKIIFIFIMAEIKFVEERVWSGIKYIKNDVAIIMNLKLHFFDRTFWTGAIEISEEGEDIIIKGDKNTLENIKKFLKKRDSLGNVVWSLIQSEYRTLDRLEERIHRIQNDAIYTSSKQMLADILKIKKDLTTMHRDYLRLRNVVESVIDDEPNNKTAQKILRDINELIDVDVYLIDGITTAIQIMQNTLSMRMNEVMKILTVIATIMMPLTLITGIYGMNFKNMPELSWEYGYFFTLLLMLGIAIIMVIYFRRAQVI